MNSVFKECPVCGSKNFFIRTQENGLQFFNITTENEIKATSALKTPPKINPEDVFSCTQCSWEGKLGELK